MTAPERLFRDQGALAALCGKHAIRRLSLFGSVLKGTARPDSAVDLLAEFVPGSEPGLLGLGAIDIQLSDLLGGRRVDLRTSAYLSRHFRNEVTSTAAAQYPDEALHGSRTGLA
jgi:predicted nucleotidyltransferase